MRCVGEGRVENKRIKWHSCLVEGAIPRRRVPKSGQNREGFNIKYAQGEVYNREGEESDELRDNPQVENEELIGATSARTSLRW